MPPRQLTVEESRVVKLQCLAFAEQITQADDSALNEAVLSHTRTMLARRQMVERQDPEAIKRYTKSSSEAGVLDNGILFQKINKNRVRSTYAYIFRRIGMFHLATDGMAFVGETFRALVPRQARDIGNSKDHRCNESRRICSVIGGFFVLDPNCSLATMSLEDLKIEVPGPVITLIDNLINMANNDVGDTSQEIADEKDRIQGAINRDIARESDKGDPDMVSRLPGQRLLDIEFDASICSTQASSAGVHVISRLSRVSATALRDSLHEILSE